MIHGSVLFTFEGFRIYVDVAVPEDYKERQIAEIATNKLRSKGVEISQLDYHWEVWLV